MGDDTVADDLSPELLQEAVDAIVRQFGSPSELRLSYSETATDGKRTEFIVPSAETDADVAVTLQQDHPDDRPTVTAE